jgi:hypothetical protein
VLWRHLKAHWRGELSLAWSYWINGVALRTLSGLGLAVLAQPLEEQARTTALVLGGLMIVAGIVLTGWQSVGIWRSASHSSKRTSRRFWPVLAKITVVAGCLIDTLNLGTATADFVRLSSTLRDPLLADYRIERRAEHDLVLTGVINETSVEAIIEALADPALAVLWVNSRGGLIEPATRLARLIRRKEVVVVAEDECISACVMLLAASPNASIFPYTQVTFHRPEPVMQFTNLFLRRQSEQVLAGANDIYLELGIDRWAIEAAGREEFWTPTIDQMMRMGLISRIYDRDAQDFVPAYQYCMEHAEACS